MATYAIGDLHGCYRPFLRLLDTLQFDPRHDRLWLVGDLVNRGPESLEVLRWCYEHQDCVHAVLGNHDVYLLGRAADIVKIKDDDTIEDLLIARDGPELLEWLRQRPLVYREDNWLMVHAGVYPSWSADETEDYARDLEKRIRTGDRNVLANLLQKGPARIDGKSTKADRRRFALRVMTRMRMCKRNGALDDSHKGRLEDAPSDLTPWFAVPKRAAQDVTIVFGHWSALGLYIEDRVVGLDSGCVWGRALTAMRLEDRQVFRVACSA